MENLKMTSIMFLSKSLSRINMILGCLPDDLQENMNKVKINLTKILEEEKFDVRLCEVKMLNFLDKVSLYTELNSIHYDLGICILIDNGNVLLEDALYNIDYIINKMVEYDSVFRCCYNNNVKTRILS